jgi:hypothetical protein
MEADDKEELRMNSKTCRFIFSLILSLLIGVGCSPPVAAPPVVTPTIETHPTALSDEEKTLGSLQKVDDHPLYTMHFFGTYDTRQSFSFSLPATASGSGGVSWGCSLFAALGDDSNMLYGRNFDWEHSPAVLLLTEPPGGYASVSMVDIAYLGFAGDRAVNLADLSLADRRPLLRAPSLPFDGMNARGLAVGMAAVPAGQMKNDPDKPTIGSLTVIRKILDSAATVDEAVAIFRQFNINMGGGPPLHYLIADRTGRAVLVEFYQGTMQVIPNETPYHQATNFLQSSVQNPARQCWRRDAIAQRLAQTGGRTNAGDAMQLLSDVSQDITQWSIVYGMTAADVTVTMGRQYEKQHRFNLTLNRR